MILSDFYNRSSSHPHPLSLGSKNQTDRLSHINTHTHTHTHRHTHIHTHTHTHTNACPFLMLHYVPKLKRMTSCMIHLYVVDRSTNKFFTSNYSA